MLAVTFSTQAKANWYQDIIDAITREATIGNGFLNGINLQQGEILTSQQDIEKLMKEVNGGLTSHSGWGAYQSHDYQSYGSGASDWAGIMQMAKNGSGTGALGKTLNSINSQFPIDSNTFSKGISDTNSQKYYSIQSQTVLAVRAASQLEYDKIQDQINYQQMLQQQIEKTKDLKSAVDLNNRIQVETNLINLGILRQSALSNQQNAVYEQANLNSALLNSKFLTKQ